MITFIAVFELELICDSTSVNINETSFETLLLFESQS